MEGFLFSLEVMAIGFSVVVIVLFALNLVFQGFGRFLTNDSAKREARKTEKLIKEKDNIVTEKSYLVPEKETGSDLGISPEILAVITGAVSAYMEKPGYRLRVKKIRRGNHLAPWVLSGPENVIITYGREI